MPHRSPCASDLHTDHIPYRHSLTRSSPRLARFLACLQSTHGGSSRQLTSYQPRPAADPLKYAPSQFTQIPCVGEGGMGVSVRRRFAMRRRLRRRRQGAGAASSSGGGPAWYLAPIWLPVMWNSGPDTASGKPMILRPAAANHNSFLSKATQRTHGL